MLNDIAYIAAAMLIPLVPAYVLYKALPAKASVGGPFQGLNIQLSGAFAGYFLLVLIVFAFLYTRPKVVPPPPSAVYKYDVYRVEGKIHIAKQKELQEIRLSLMPPEHAVKPNGVFEFEIPVRPGQVGEATFPSLIIEHPGYETETVDLRTDTPTPQQSDDCHLHRHCRPSS